MIPINPPPRPTGTESQQLEALYKYLYTLHEKLNLIHDQYETELKRLREGGTAK